MAEENVMETPRGGFTSRVLGKVNEIRQRFSKERTDLKRDLPDPSIVQEEQAVSVSDDNKIDTSRPDADKADSDISILVKSAIQEFREGFGVPSLSAEIQEQTRARLSECEARLNTLFPASIGPEKTRVAETVKFLNTNEFYKKVSLKEGKSPETVKEMFEAITLACSVMGVRDSENNDVMVHTTAYSKGRSPVQITPEQAFSVARHEMVHGKVAVKTEDIADGAYLRKTGCKVITIRDGQETDVKHSSLYEAQTDVLAIISSHPEVGSWKEVFRNYIRERAHDNDDYGSQLSAMTRLMDFVFDDFDSSVTLLGETYFQCDGEKFLDSLYAAFSRKVGGDTALIEQYEEFIKYSEKNDPSGMTNTVTKILSPKNSDRS